MSYTEPALCDQRQQFGIDAYVRIVTDCTLNNSIADVRYAEQSNNQVITFIIQQRLSSPYVEGFRFEWASLGIQSIF